MVRNSLTICIPSLNRAESLLKVLRSVSQWIELSKSDAQVLVSNNASDESYLKIEEFCVAHSFTFLSRQERLDLDQHMHFVIQRASSTYVLLLGDDDVLERESIQFVEHGLEKNCDLAVFGVPIGAHGSYSDSIDAYKQLRPYSAFGQILVRREHLRSADFKLLYGTYHAYGCYWMTLQRQSYSGQNVLILSYAAPLSRSTKVKKTYDYLSLYYDRVIRANKLRRSVLGEALWKAADEDFYKALLKQNRSLSFMSIAFRGHDYEAVRRICCSHIRINPIKIFVAFYCLAPLRSVARKVKGLICF